MGCAREQWKRRARGGPDREAQVCVRDRQLEPAGHLVGAHIVGERLQCSLHAPHFYW